MNKTAHFSPDRSHRYHLTRVWGNPDHCVMFIGLNPSTADENQDDPTIRRVVRFAKDWGYGGVVMVNLFTQVTAYPKDLDLQADRDLLDWPIIDSLPRCQLVVAAWGNFPEAQKRATEVARRVPVLHCLGINKNGSPKHPLYIPANTKPIEYRNMTHAPLFAGINGFGVAADWMEWDQLLKLD